MAFNLNDDMARRWGEFIRAANLRDAGDQVLQHLLGAYTAPDRHYHGLPHIHHCLLEHESVRSACPESPAVEAAIWFHDVVYDPPSSVNEQKSADVADQTLSGMGMLRPQIDQVRALILDTTHQSRPRTLAGQFMVDIDLSSMGQSPERFDADGRAIRAEYHYVDDAAFARGRAALFERLRARPSIYYTDTFRDRYESKARENLARSLARLRSAAP
jgi:predicted metal-dependent HD superfamily phosphohydrolase